jgi:hypothetical protein
MLCTIQLDDQLLGEAHEIDDIGPDRLLPPELVACEASIA